MSNITLTPSPSIIKGVYPFFLYFVHTKTTVNFFRVLPTIIIESSSSSVGLMTRVRRHKSRI